MLHEAELHSTLLTIMVQIIDHFKEKKKKKKKKKKCPIPAHAKMPYPAPLCPKILAGALLMH